MPSARLAILVLCLRFWALDHQFALVKAAGSLTNGQEGGTGSDTTGSNYVNSPNNPNNPTNNPNGYSTAGSNNANGYGTAESNNANGYGTEGSNNANGYGTEGSNNANGYGTEGSNTNGYGTAGSNNADGSGAVGSNTNGYGTAGSNNANGYGTAGSNNADGSGAVGSNTNGYGTAGSNNANGYGTAGSNNADGSGTVGSNNANGYGTEGSNNANGYGIEGSNTNGYGTEGSNNANGSGAVGSNNANGYGTAGSNNADGSGTVGSNNANGYGTAGSNNADGSGAVGSNNANGYGTAGSSNANGYGTAGSSNANGYGAGSNNANGYGTAGSNNANGYGTAGSSNQNNPTSSGSSGSGVSDMSNSSFPGTGNQSKWDLSMDPCGTSGAMSLTPELWASERIDEYMEYKKELRNYTILQYATSLGMPNFNPGIGFPIQAGQICYPAIGRDYLVMYAIEKWNTFMNSMYTAVEATTLMLMDVSAGIVADFIPPGIGTETSTMGFAIATIVVGIVGFFTGPLAPIVYSMGVGAKMARGISDAAKMSAAIAMGTQAQRRAYVAGRAAAQAGNMAKVEAAMKAGDIYTLRRMVYNGQDLVATSGKFPDFMISPQQMTKINRMLGYADNTPRPVINKGGSKATDASETADSATEGGQATQNVGQPATMPATNPTSRMRRRNRRSYAVQADPGFEKELQRRSHQHMKRGIPNVYTYTRWSFLCTHLARLRNEIQGYLNLSMQLVNESPFWSTTGIAPQIYGGAMLVPNPSYTELESRHKSLGMIAIISELFVSLDYIGIIGLNPCDKPGPSEINGDRGPLRECDDKGIAWSIVKILPGDNYDEWVHKPRILSEKYKLGSMDLVKRAWDCQVKYGVYGNNSAPTVVDANSPCAFQLPICDFTNQDFKNKFNHDHPLAACRDVFQLPI